MPQMHLHTKEMPPVTLRDASWHASQASCHWVPAREVSCHSSIWGGRRTLPLTCPALQRSPYRPGTARVQSYRAHPVFCSCTGLPALPQNECGQVQTQQSMPPQATLALMRCCKTCRPWVALWDCDGHRRHFPLQWSGTLNLQRMRDNASSSVQKRAAAVRENAGNLGWLPLNMARCCICVEDTVDSRIKLGYPARW